MSDKEQNGITVSVSNIKDRIWIYGLIILVGGSSALNIVIPTRPDPFTGSDGDYFDDRITVLEFEVKQCQKRNGNHRENQAGILAKLEANVKNNKDLINRCLRITGQ